MTTNPTPPDTDTVRRMRALVECAGFLIDELRAVSVAVDSWRQDELIPKNAVEQEALVKRLDDSLHNWELFLAVSVFDVTERECELANEHAADGQCEGRE
jgi:hypothetical protein